MKRLVGAMTAVALLIALPHAAAQLAGVVEIEMRIERGELFFDPVGVWVEPGTTIRFVLVDGVHDTQAYHPDNSTELMRIPDGAEPWDSGMLGGPDSTGVFEVTLTVEGVYDYFCSPHVALGMVGRIVVGDPDEAPARSVDELPHEAARAALPSVEEILAQEIVRWHAEDPDGAPDEEPTAGVDLGAWEGDAKFTTETFAVAGPWEITLGAWCFEGVGFVRVVAFDLAGEEVGRVTVIGEGVESVELETEPGEYYLEVTVSHMHTYRWEVEATQLGADGGDADAAGHGMQADDPATGMVTIPMAWDGTDAFTTQSFEADGPWELVFGAWCYDGVSFARATVYDQAGLEVDQVTVVGEGVQSALVNSGPGVFYVEVTSPNMAAYHWELVVQPTQSAAHRH